MKNRQPTVYDKAKYHFEGRWPAGLDRCQAYVHTGMYLAWLIDRRLTSEEVSPSLADDVRSRRQTGPAVFRELDGVLDSGMLTPVGRAFTEKYFRLAQGGGQFARDYQRTLATGLESMYHVTDNWENYERLRSVLDARFAEWRTANVSGLDQE